MPPESMWLPEILVSPKLLVLPPHSSHYKAISASSVIISLSVGCQTVKIKETIKKKQDKGYDLQV